MKPLARSNDPETSQLAAIRHRPKLAKRASQVLELCKRYPGRTAGELGVLMWNKHKGDMSIGVAASTPHKRLKEMERKLIVHRGRIRRCTDSGESAYEWWIV